MAVSSADYTTVVTACRRELARGGGLMGEDLRLVIDVVEDAANTLDSKAVSTAAALEALLVTHFGILVADGAAPTQGHVDDMVAACATPRANLTAAAAASVTNVTVDDKTDGRFVAD